MSDWRCLAAGSLLALPALLLNGCEEQVDHPKNCGECYQQETGNCFAACKAKPCFNATDELECTTRYVGTSWCVPPKSTATGPSDGPSEDVETREQPESCGCTGEHNCYIRGWAAPCSNMQLAKACEDQNGIWCPGTKGWAEKCEDGKQCIVKDWKDKYPINIETEAQCLEQDSSAHWCGCGGTLW